MNCSYTRKAISLGAISAVGLIILTAYIIHQAVGLLHFPMPTVAQVMLLTASLGGM